MDRRAPLYLMIWDDTYTRGWNVNRSEAEAETAEHAPTAIMPDAWTTRPVARLQRPGP